MKPIALSLVILSLLGSGLAAADRSRPNVVYILADDK